MAPLLAVLLTALAMGAEVSEHQVKAAFLYNFVKFVTWPPGAFSSPTDPIALCVLGTDPFGADLDRVVRGKTVESRPFTVLRIGTSAAARHCHVVFIAAAEQVRTREFLRDLRGLPILTVGEIHDFLAYTGVINFVLENGQVRFEINLEAADSAHLKISSRLLALARVVQVGWGPKGGESCGASGISRYEASSPSSSWEPVVWRCSWLAAPWLPTIWWRFAATPAAI